VEDGQVTVWLIRLNTGVHVFWYRRGEWVTTESRAGWFRNKRAADAVLASLKRQQSWKGELAIHEKVMVEASHVGKGRQG
jgi:hypothetical protein